MGVAEAVKARGDKVPGGRAQAALRAAAIAAPHLLIIGVLQSHVGRHTASFVRRATQFGLRPPAKISSGH